jgi:hypothetical protein
MNIYKNKLLKLFLLILLLLPVKVYSGEIEYEIDGYIFSGTSRNKHINESHITILGFTIGEHSLKDIQSKLGNTNILRKEECSTIQICYSSNLNSDKTIVVFETDAMGGWDELTTIYIFSDKANFPNFKQCKKSELISKEIQTKSGLKLGINKKQLKGILGEPTNYIKDDLFYIYETKRKMTKEEIEGMSKQWPDVKDNPYFDEFSYIHAKFIDDKMTYLSISKSESY